MTPIALALPAFCSVRTKTAMSPALAVPPLFVVFVRRRNGTATHGRAATVERIAARQKARLPANTVPRFYWPRRSDGRRPTCEEEIDQVEDVTDAHDAVAVHVAGDALQVVALPGDVARRAVPVLP